MAFLVFVALWLDGSFYPLILLPFLFIIFYEREGLGKIGLGGLGLCKSLLLGAGVGIGLSIIYYPIFVYYIPRRTWAGLDLGTLFTDLIWYPFYEEVTYRGFFLGSFADSNEGLTRHNLAVNFFQSTLFVFVHQNHIRAGLWMLLILIFALGFSMGLVFLRTRNIAGCVLGHSLVNGIANVFPILFIGI